MSDDIEEPKKKPILCLDFDGVIHDYLRGWQDGTIYGAPTPGFFDWAVHAHKYFTLVIYSSRSKTEEGREAMENWLRHFLITWRHESMSKGSNGARDELKFDFASEKPAAFLTIDDRAVTFTGRWDAPFLNPAELVAFKPWTEPHVLYKLPEDLGKADAAQRASGVAPPPDALRKCPRHPWMTQQAPDGSRFCNVSTCGWKSPAPS